MQTAVTTALNQAAGLVPMTGDDPDLERPSIRVAEVLVFVYVEDDEDGRRRLVVSVDLDDVDWDDGPGPQETVPLRINVQGVEVVRFD